MSQDPELNESEALRRGGGGGMATRKAAIQAVVMTLVLACIPAFFAGMMVWAMQDPLHRLDLVPAAVVDEDTEVALDTGDSTTTLDLGKEITDNIFANADGDNFAWTRTDATSAAQGLAEGRYYVVLTIPKTFTADATSAVLADPKNPQTAQLTVTTNDALNYLTGSIAEGMGKTIANTVSQKVAAEFAEHVYVHFNDIHENLSDAADNSVKLVDGAANASEGASKLLGGLAKLREKSAALPAKVAKLRTGTNKALAGAEKLNSGATKLLAGAKAMNEGATTAAANVGKLSSGAQTLAGNLSSMTTGAGGLAAALKQLEAGYTSMPDTQKQAMIHQLATRAADLATGATKATSGAQGLAAGSQQLDTGLASMSAGAGKLVTGAGALHTGATKELAGLRKLKQGITKMSSNIPLLVTGAQKAYEGGTKLDEGMAKLVHGTTQMHKGLAEGADNMPTFSDHQVDSLPDYVSDSVAINAGATNELPSFGGALAPFFLSIALWIGCLGFFMIRPILSTKALASGSPAVRVLLRSLAFPGAVAVAQGLVAVWTISSLVGIGIADAARLSLLAVLVSITFMAINQALGALLGPAGRFLAIIFLICQVASAGGIFPIQTAPPFVQWLSSTLPLGHAVQGFKSMIAGGSLGYGDAVAMLVIWLVVALVLTFVGVVKARRVSALGAGAAT